MYRNIPIEIFNIILSLMILSLIQSLDCKKIQVYHKLPKKFRAYLVWLTYFIEPVAEVILKLVCNKFLNSTFDSYEKEFKKTEKKIKKRLNWQLNSEDPVYIINYLRNLFFNQ